VEHALADHLGHGLVLARGQLEVRLLDPFGRAREALARRILAEFAEEAPDQRGDGAGFGP